MPIAIREAFWRTGRWHRDRKGRHHPGKRAFLKFLLRGPLVRDLCITGLAPDFKIDARTLGRWVRALIHRGALLVEEHGRGRQLGLRVAVQRARLRALIGELDIGERELAGKRKRRCGFLWFKSDPSPTPLLRGREKDLPRPISQILSAFRPNSWTPAATRFRDPDDPDALRAAIKGRNGETKAKIPMETENQARAGPEGQHLSQKPAHEPDREREIRRSRREISEIPIEQMPDWLQHFVKLGTQSVSRETPTQRRGLSNSKLVVK
jgi:transposase-like protein